MEGVAICISNDGGIGVDVCQGWNTNPAICQHQCSVVSVSLRYSTLVFVNITFKLVLDISTNFSCSILIKRIPKFFVYIMETPVRQRTLILLFTLFLKIQSKRDPL